MADAAPEVIRNEEESRFEVAGEGDKAVLKYVRSDGTLRLVSTEVDDALEGQGVGSALVREALAHAESEGLTIVPVCGFVSSWLERHPDRAAELDIVEP